MSYPLRLQQYREKLSLRQGELRSVFEVLAPDVLCFPSTDSKKVNWGVFNNKKNHWALFVDTQAVSFVWDVEQVGDETLVTGASCITDYDRLKNLENNWIGATRLSIRDIQGAGMIT